MHNMKTNLIKIGGWVYFWLLTLLPYANAGFPEPYNLIYGLIKLDGQMLTAQNTNVFIEARRIPTGPAVARYQMGSQASANNYYALKVRLESVTPLSDETSVSTPSNILYLVVVANNQVKDQLEYVVGDRGNVKRLDFGAIDNDDDGLPDGWEQAYLYGLGYGPNDDPDHDGLDNLTEYRLGTNPLRPDARHPADTNQDWRITIAELSSYYNAWRQGMPWPNGPTNIPVEYVTRATYIWEQGEYYKFDTTLTNAPLWWVSIPPTNVAALAAVAATVSNTVSNFASNQHSVAAFQDPVVLDSAPAAPTPTPEKQLAAEEVLTATTMANKFYIPGTEFSITNRVLLVTNARTYAVEHYPPAGWQIVQVPGGTYDAERHRVKWGPFLDRQNRDLVYVAKATNTQAGAQSLGGLASYDGHKVSLRGQASIVSLPVREHEFARVPFGKPEEWVFVGKPGTAYVLEAATNLFQWKVVSTATAGSDGQVKFADPEAGSSSVRFYRAKMLTTP